MLALLKNGLFTSSNFSLAVEGAHVLPAPGRSAKAGGSAETSQDLCLEVGPKN